MAKMTRAFCHLVLLVTTSVDESPKELSLIEVSPELKLSQENPPQNLLAVLAAQEEKFKLAEEIYPLCGSTNV